MTIVGWATGSANGTRRESRRPCLHFLRVVPTPPRLWRPSENGPTCCLRFCWRNRGPTPSKARWGYVSTAFCPNDHRKAPANGPHAVTGSHAGVTGSQHYSAAHALGCGKNHAIALPLDCERVAATAASDLDNRTDHDIDLPTLWASYGIGVFARHISKCVVAPHPEV